MRRQKVDLLTLTLMGKGRCWRTAWQQDRDARLARQRSRER